MASDRASACSLPISGVATGSDASLLAPTTTSRRVESARHDADAILARAVQRHEIGAVLCALRDHAIGTANDRGPDRDALGQEQSLVQARAFFELQRPRRPAARAYALLPGSAAIGRYDVIVRMRHTAHLARHAFHADARTQMPRLGERTYARSSRPPRRTRRASRARVPTWIDPQLATLLAQPPAAGAWMYEVKYDGYRVLARIGDGVVELYSRNGRDITAKLPALAQALAGVPAGTWLDGELAVVDAHGRSDFQRLQNAMGAGGAHATYHVFDAPWLGGADVSSLPLRERRARLAAVLADMGTNVAFALSRELGRDGERALALACEQGLEGVIGKRGDAPYRGGRSADWIKLKCRPRQEFVVVGYTEPTGRRVALGALLLAVREGSQMRYAGRVGTGFGEAALRTLHARLEPLAIDAPAVRDAPRATGVHWVAPSLVVEVQFTGWTDAGVVRQASFVGVREDKGAHDVVRETPKDAPAAAALSRASGARRASAVPSPGVRGVAITHPERPMYTTPNVAKLDVARYYDRVAEAMLPHVAGRPLSIVRCPDGVAGRCFFQKHLRGRLPPGLVRTEAVEGADPFLVVENAEGLVGLVQHGVVEVHTWGAHCRAPHAPDRIVLDLDPDPSLRWSVVLDAARRARALLEGLGLRTFVKTTGGKGLHVVAPIEPTLGWDEVKAFASSLAHALEREAPDRFVARAAKSARAGRVFVDYLRNAEQATAVAAWSLRVREGAPVSVPLSWDELDVRRDVRGARWSIANAARRLARCGAPWDAYGTTRQRLTASMRRALG